MCCGFLKTNKNSNVVALVQLGLQLILQTPAAIDQVAIAMIEGEDALRMEVLDLLTVIAWVSVEGHMAVMEALANKKFRRRFQLVVKALAVQSDNTELKLRIMTFINAMINASDVLEGRVAVRREFIDLNFIEVLHVSNEPQR